MKSKKIFFAFIFLLKTHSAHAGLGDDKFKKILKEVTETELKKKTVTSCEEFRKKTLPQLLENVGKEMEKELVQETSVFLGVKEETVTTFLQKIRTLLQKGDGQVVDQAEKILSQLLENAPKEKKISDRTDLIKGPALGAQNKRGLQNHILGKRERGAVVQI